MLHASICCFINTRKVCTPSINFKVSQVNTLLLSSYENNIFHINTMSLFLAVEEKLEREGIIKDLSWGGEKKREIHAY